MNDKPVTSLKVGGVVFASIMSMAAPSYFMIKSWYDRTVQEEGNRVYVDSIYEIIAGEDRIIEDKEIRTFLDQIGFSAPMLAHDNLILVPRYDGIEVTLQSGMGLEHVKGVKGGNPLPRKISIEKAVSFIDSNLPREK